MGVLACCAHAGGRPLESEAIPYETYLQAGGLLPVRPVAGGPGALGRVRPKAWRKSRPSRSSSRRKNQQLQTQLDSLREDQAPKAGLPGDAARADFPGAGANPHHPGRTSRILNESIGQLTLKLEASQAEVQDTIDLFKQRLVALYTAGNVSTLEILLDSRACRTSPPAWSLSTPWPCGTRKSSASWRTT